MKTIKFLVSERFGIENWLNDLYQKGGLSLTMLTDAQNLLRKITIPREFNEKPEKGLGFPRIYKAIKEEEAKKVNLRIEVNIGNDGKQITSLKWNASKDKGKEIELTSDEIKMIKEIIERKNSEKAFSLTDNFVIGLAEKIGVDLEKKEEAKEAK